MLVLAGWTLVLRGLYLLPASQDPGLDLDAGASFDLNLSVYLPAVLLSVLLVVALPIAVGRRGAVLLSAALATATLAFALWVLNRQELTSHIPGLASSLWGAAGLSATALLVCGAGLALRSTRH